MYSNLKVVHSLLLLIVASTEKRARHAGRVPQGREPDAPQTPGQEHLAYYRHERLH